jgi:CDP-diacylglycerol--serine O-phosphatidyltransferase
LARFNVRAAADKRYFEGLPSPSAAAVVSAFIWLSSEWREPGLPGLVVAFTVTACAGALMVSPFSYSSFKQLNLVGPMRFAGALLVLLVFIGIAVYPPVALLTLFGGYAAIGAVQGIWRRLRRAQPRS